jgi:hypothetical protein
MYHAKDILNYEYLNDMKLHQITIPYVVIKIGNTYETNFLSFNIDVHVFFKI